MFPRENTVKRLVLMTMLLLVPYATADAQIFHMAEMNTEEIRALDGQKTVVRQNSRLQRRTSRRGSDDSASG